MRLAMAREGYQVFEAENGTAALKLFTQAVPDLVLLSLVLPDMHGFGLVPWLRTLPGGSVVPILAMSDSHVLLKQARHVGFNGFLFRPHLPSFLLQTIFPFFPSLRPQAGLPSHLWRCPAGSDAIPDQSISGHHSPAARILLVEPNDYQCLHLLCHLTEQGFAVIPVQDGWEAVHHAQVICPDAVISNPLVPGLDGFELCLEMRKDPRTAAIPIILTPLAMATEVDAELAQAVGATGYVSRTPDSCALTELLKTILRRPRVVVSPSSS
jgi:DNA-binding response OmpR family regulator